jgi:hypothetical protein
MVGVSAASGASFTGVIVDGDGTVVVASALGGVGHVDVVGAVNVCPDEP